jgi:hypothetical protein
MDEILSIRLVEKLRSPLGVFTDIHSDNNHYLNSMWLWVVGSRAPGWLIRLPTLLLGAALVVLAYRITRPRGRTVATVTAALFAASYPLIHYSSEARGYGYLVFFTLVAYGAFRLWISGGGLRAGAIYALGSALAFLSHLGFATVFAAFLLWSLLEVLGRKANRARAAGAHLTANVLPALTLLLLYLVDIRFMTAVGGFERMGPIESLAGAMRVVVGLAPGALAAVLALCAWGAIVLGTLRSYEQDRNETVFLVTAIAFALASGALPGYGYPRYYLTALLFSLLFLGRAIAVAFESRRCKVVGFALLVSVVAVNVAQALHFAAIGRGMYREAALYMAEKSHSAVASVAGNHDMGSLLALEYHGTVLPEGTRLEYYCHDLSIPGCSLVRPSRAAGDEPPEFYLLASLDDRFSPPPTMEVPDLTEYEFMRSFPKYGLSGLYWAVYGSPGRATSR